MGQLHIYFINRFSLIKLRQKKTKFMATTVIVDVLKLSKFLIESSAALLKRVYPCVFSFALQLIPRCCC